MTRVDFYILESAGADAGPLVACRLAEKAYGLGHRVYIHTGDDQGAQAIDDLLWTFRAGSFVPHALYTENEAHDEAVLIGADEGPDSNVDVLINLAEAVPLFFSRFGRVAEIVTGDASVRESARERFRFYRERGYDLETHRLDG